MNAIILEDEKLSAEHLCNLLTKIDPSIAILRVFDSVKESIAAFQAGLKADLLFVDIHLADGLSFDIFTAVNIETPIIFTTAYDEYAIRAFKLNSLDYLLKPIGLEDLQYALKKFKSTERYNQSALLDRLMQSYLSMNKQYKNRFMIKIGESIVSVKTEQVAHFVFEDGLVLLATTTDRRYPVDFTLDQLEAMLDPSGFFRINRKVILSINAIQKTSAYFNSRLKITSPGLGDDHSVVSRERVSAFKEWLGM